MLSDAHVCCFCRISEVNNLRSFERSELEHK